LETATCYNYVGSPFSATAAIIETYFYGARQGRASSRKTQMIYNGRLNDPCVAGGAPRRHDVLVLLLMLLIQLGFKQSGRGEFALPFMRSTESLVVDYLSEKVRATDYPSVGRW
jgi:hypothetical protein